MLFPDDPHSHVSESDRLGEPVIVLFEVNVPIKRHRNIAQQQPAPRRDLDAGITRAQSGHHLQHAELLDFRCEVLTEIDVVPCAKVVE